MKKRAIVIGGGFGGLAAAVRLLALGYHVAVIDRQDKLGGRAYVYEWEGFRFDAGPTVITAPFLLEELFAIHHRQLSDYVALIPVTPWYRLRFHDGTVFNYGGSQESIEREIRRLSPEDVDGYRRLVSQSREIFDVGFTQLGDKPFHSAISMIKAAPDMMRLRSYRTVYQLASSYIKDERLRQVFSFQPLLVGGNPFSTTSIYSLIQHVEREWGVHYALGGTGALVEALHKLILECGGEVKLKTTVSEILFEGRRATAVKTVDGSVLKADLIVSNGDPPFVYKNLLRKLKSRRWTEERLNKLQFSMGLFVLYIGAARTFPEVAHHTILLGPRYRGLLSDIFERKILSDDFSLYLHVPTRSDPSMAPEGHECIYVLCPVPNLQGKIDWSIEGPKLKEKIISHLEETELPGLRRSMIYSHYVTPTNFEVDLLSLHGAGFSIQPLLIQSAYFRFHNRSEDLENLYFVGAGTHPGAGLPGVLCSAKVLQNLLESEPGSILD